MFPVLLKFGPITIYSFGVLMALGFFLGATAAAREYQRRLGEDPGGEDTPHADAIWSLLVWVFIAGLASSRVLSIFNDPAAFIENPLEVFSGAGFVWYGGFLGGLVAAVLLTRRRAMPLIHVIDSTAIGLALGQGIGRIGCHVAGDGDWGRVTELPWGVAYERAIIGWPHPEGILVHPTPLYEATCYLAVFALLWKLRLRNPAPGVLFCLYLLGNAVPRFLIEFIRVERVVAFGLTQAQLVAIVLFTVAVVGLARIRARRGSLREAVP